MKKDIRKSSEHRLPEETIGIDLGDKMSHYAILSGEGTLVEEGTFRNQPESIRLHFSGKPARIALEVGSQSAWISRELKQLGHEVIVANARQLKWITAGDNKHDRVDARKLARLARVGEELLAPVEHRSAEQQADLSVIRSRDALVRARTLLVNAARGIAKGVGHRRRQQTRPRRCPQAGATGARRRTTAGSDRAPQCRSADRPQCHPFA